MAMPAADEPLEPIDARRAFRVPPHDLDAEAGVLGTMLMNVQARDEAASRLAPRDFYGPQHASAFRAIVALHADGDPITAVTLADWCTRNPALAVDVSSADVAAWHRHVPASYSVGGLCRIVAGHAAKRRAIAEAERLVTAAYDPTSTAAEIGELAEALPAAVALPVGAVAAGPGVRAWLEESDPVPEWVIPGFVERGEEIAFTGWIEGGGKTTLLRQLAVQGAAGIVPFSGAQTCAPARVLMVDCENRESQSRRKFRPLVVTAGDALDDESRLVVKCRPEGLDLLGQRDREWLVAHIEANRPDLLLLGPLYKLHEDDPTAEQPARRLSAFLDKIVVRYRLGLIVEAHPPNEAQGFKRPLRIYGASLWRRWFETGLGIAEPGDEQSEDSGLYPLIPWRVTRDDRLWPRKLSRGGQWPWSRDPAESMGGIR